jgi:hypothetical protein
MNDYIKAQERLALGRISWFSRILIKLGGYRINY